ncbi:hypothetical protein [Streptomyces sp. IMTB 2501]|uniref:hypothetical protein n=1 Tax=Streptomyces sp. IMTB 2501 TaxID=1776340 RepID=UPI00096F5445|nr:hypothetical protein [Streptomyces sp. IMTB 2501]
MVIPAAGSLAGADQAEVRHDDHHDAAVLMAASPEAAEVGGPTRAEELRRVVLVAWHELLQPFLGVGARTGVVQDQVVAGQLGQRQQGGVEDQHTGVGVVHRLDRLRAGRPYE